MISFIASICLAVICLICLPQLNAQYPAEFIAQVRNYPNIMHSKEECLPLKGNYEHAQTLVCDPARLLTVTQINRLNTILHEVKDTVNRDGSTCDSNKPRPVIGVALVNKLKVGNPSRDRLLSYAAVFAYYLFTEWSLPTNCNLESDKIIILYSKDDGVLYTFAGNLLKTKLPPQQIINTAVQSRLPFSNGIYEGISYLIERYREAVKSGPVDLFDKP